MIRATRQSPETAAGIYVDRTLDVHLAHAAEAFGDRIALVEGGARFTYAELAVRVARCAAGLYALGLRRGDAIMILLPNWWEAIVAIQAALKIGAVVNPVVPIYRGAELGFIIRQSMPKIIVLPHNFRRFDYVEMMQGILASAGAAPRIVVIRPLAALPDDYRTFESLDTQGDVPDFGSGAAEDISLLLYTSGTTADPKGVLHSHRTLDYEIRSIADLFGLTGDDTVFMPSPITHITGYLYGVLMPPMLGAASVCLDQWNAETGADLIEAHTCRFTMAATPFLHALTDVYAGREQASSLKIFLCGGADVPPALIRRARTVMGTEVSRIYGSSEFPTFSSGTPGCAIDIAADTDGLPIGPVAARIDGEPGQIGELLVKGPDLFVGYLDDALNADAFTQDGFFRTGDLARIDDRGAVTICGRSKDIIVRGGEKISAKQVEDILYQHEMVEQVAVTAMPDPILTEKACAFVVPKPGCTPTLADLTAFLDARGLARQKFPERLELVDALPMTASGKVQKFKLRERLRNEAG